ncbi:hypothetical protein EII17_08195 [Clostridiales bacterium COT073_COT-073]|nr:hypothetical protein EII17_08195 [Clostridiales bacterium COT073_COT-073]
MKHNKFFLLIAWLLCLQLIFSAISLPLRADEPKPQLLVNESFQDFEGNVPAGFAIFNKDGGDITFEVADEIQKRAAKYQITNLAKNLNFQYNFSAPVNGQLVFETKVRAEDANLYFPIFELRNSKRVSCLLASLSGGKIKVGADNKVLAAYTPGSWYHLHFALNLQTGKMDVYLNGTKKLEAVNFWATDKKTGKIKEVKEVKEFKSYLKGQAGKTLVVYQDDIRVYTGTAPVFDPAFFEKKPSNPDEDNPLLPQEPLPDYYENPSATKIIEDLKAFNPGNEHPRLFFRKDSLAALKQKVASDPLAQKWYEDLIKDGNKILKEPVGKYELPDGRRMPAAKTARPRIETTALLYLLSGEQKYLDRAVTEIKAMIAFPDWNHQNEFLNTAEMAAGIAIGYDWLYADLSDELKAEMRKALIDKALKKAKAAYASNVWWSVKRALVNNWNAVCNGGIGMAALAIGDENPGIAGHVLEKAIPSLERGILTEFVPDGGWGEGPGYWRYTIEYVTSFLASLETATGRMYGMEKTPGLKETAYFPIYLTGPNGSFNYADATSNKMKMPELLWLANQLNDPAIAEARLRLMDEARQKGGVYDLIWYDPQLRGELKLDTDKYFREVEVVTMRSQWNNPYAQFIGFKGGCGYTSHGHLDIGNFVYQANGQTWAEDLGSDNYANSYFDYHNQRFHFYRAKPEGHNTLVINPDGNYQQNHETKNPMIRTEFKPKGALAVLDMSGAYDKNASVAKRGLLFTHNREQLIVQDEVQLKKPSDVYWFMHTLADVDIQPDGHSALLTKNGQKLWLEIISPNKEQLAFQVEEAKALPGEPLPAGQKDNRNYRRLFIKGRTETDYQLAVALIPLKYGQVQPTILPEFKAIDQWQIADGEITRPELKMIYLNGKALENFSASQYYYAPALPFGTKQLPVVTADSNYEVHIKKAENWLDDTVITVKDPDSPDENVTYVLKFHILPGKEQPQGSQKLKIREATASTYQNEPAKKQVNPPAHAIDGLPATRWAAEGNQWLCLELNTANVVDNVAIAFARGNARIFRFEIESSTDGTNWKLLYQGANSGDSQELEYFSVEPTLAKYIRIQGHGNSQNNWNTYSEVEVWGNPVASTASRAALEVLIASGSALQLKPEYLNNTAEKKLQLDQALANAIAALNDPALTPEQCQAHLMALKVAIALIKEPLAPHQPGDNGDNNEPEPNDPNDPEQPQPPVQPLNPFTPSAPTEPEQPNAPLEKEPSTAPLKENGQPTVKPTAPASTLTEQGQKLMALLNEKPLNLTAAESTALHQVLSNAPLKDRAKAYFQLPARLTEEMQTLTMQSFSDVSANSWYGRELTAISILHLVNGYPDGSLGGQNPISGGELVSFLLRAQGENIKSTGPDWFAGYQEKANAIGLIDDVFSSEKILTREEVAYLLAQFLEINQLKFPQNNLVVDDLHQVSSQYQNAVNRVYAAGIMQGYPKGTFRPQASLSRSEVIVILYRLLQAEK